MNQHRFRKLSDLTNWLHKTLEKENVFFYKPWIKSEISSGREKGGSFYCDLVEKNVNGKIIAKMKCIIWAGDLSNIRKKFRDSGIDLTLKDGTEVGFQCSIQYSSQYGLSLKVIDVDPSFALGELELEKRKILERLSKEGLLEPNKKIFVPMLPNRIGLITSKDSGAFKDFITTLEKSTFGFTVYLTDSVVQGLQTENSIIHALKRLEQLRVELVVIIRGGGSKVDLHYLDNETIARKIAAYKLPVWTGIGHEIDISILDHVANRYFKTPTAIAEELVARFVEMERHLDEAKSRFKSTWAYRLKIEKNWILREKTGVKQGTRKLLDATTVKLKNSLNLLSSMVKDRLTDEKTKLSVARKSLTTTPFNLIKQTRERFEDKKNRYVKESKRQIIENKKNLLILRKRFQFDRYIQVISQRKQSTVISSEQLRRVYYAEMNMRKKDIVRLKNRLRKEIILNRIQNERNNIHAKYSTLKASDPKTSLERGFSLTYKEDGKLLKSINDTYMREILRTEVSDGEIMSTVDRIGGK